MTFSYAEMWAHMGFLAKAVVCVLVLMSTISFFVIIERWITYILAKRHSVQYVSSVQEFLETGNYEEAVHFAEQHKGGYLAQVISAGIQELLTGRRDQEENGVSFDIIDATKHSIERAIDRQMNRLKKGTGALATIGSTSPFVGLFGTTVGIINAFQQMAVSGGGGLESVSVGISEALVTTAFGIFVALPAIMLYNYFTGRLEIMNSEMEQSASELLDFFTKEEARRTSLPTNPTVFPEAV